MAPRQRNDGILLIEDDPLSQRLMRSLLRQHGFQCVVAETCAAALDQVEQQSWRAIFLDISLPDGNGIDLLPQIRQRVGVTPIIMLTASGTVDNAVRAMTNGAVDFIIKPPLATTVMQCLHKHLATSPAAAEPQRTDAMAELIGHDPQMENLRHVARRMAASDETVLILGENGSGKDVLARCMHAASARHEGPFLAVNLGAISDHLCESELFGHVAGAFSGAETARDGYFRAARGGTLFLDEIGEASPSVQIRLLRALEQREITPVGADRPQRIDVRIIAATNCDLDAAIATDRFRQDLYFRLSMLVLRMPPLRQRPGDIALLASTFLADSGHHVSADALVALQAHRWPGNVRELRHVLRRAALLADQREITATNLDLTNIADGSATPAAPPVTANTATSTARYPTPIPNGTLAEQERAHILATLAQHAGDRSATAAALGIDRATLYRKLKRWGL